MNSIQRPWNITLNVFNRFAAIKTPSNSNSLWREILFSNIHLYQTHVELKNINSIQIHWELRIKLFCSQTNHFEKTNSLRKRKKKDKLAIKQSKHKNKNFNLAGFVGMIYKMAKQRNKLSIKQTSQTHHEFFLLYFSLFLSIICMCTI